MHPPPARVALLVVVFAYFYEQFLRDLCRALLFRFPQNLCSPTPQMKVGPRLGFSDRFYAPLVQYYGRRPQPGMFVIVAAVTASLQSVQNSELPSPSGSAATKMASDGRNEDGYDARDVRDEREIRSRADDRDRLDDRDFRDDRYGPTRSEDPRDVEDARHKDSDYPNSSEPEVRHGAHGAQEAAYDGPVPSGSASGHRGAQSGGGGGAGGSGGGGRSGGPPDISETVSLLVLNLSFRTTPHDLRAQFQEFGELADVYIPRNRESGESRGFA